MANRGRDLTFSLLSDTDRFELENPARDLENLADAAGDTGRALTDLDRDAAGTDLQRLGTTAKEVGRDLEKLEADAKGTDLDKLGDDAKAAAAKVDDAFEKIAASSRSNLSKVDDDTKRAAAGLDDFKDEAGSSGREAAASFSGGFEDITDFVQETAANAFGGFGVIGQAAGIAGAIGLGVIGTAVAEAKERVKELANAFRDVKIDGGDMAETVRVVLDDLKDSGDLVGLARDAKLLGVDWATLVRAMAGSVPDLENVNAKLDDLSNSGYVTHANFNEAANSFDNVSMAVGRSGEALSDASVAAQAYTEGLSAQAGASDEARQQAEDYATALEDVSGANDIMASAVESAAQRVADSTKDSKDSWTDYKDSAVTSIDDIIAAQEEALTAAAAFEANLRIVFESGGQAAVDFVLAQGEQAAAAAQAYVDAPLDKRAEVVSNFETLGHQSANGYADGIAAGSPAVETEADRLWRESRSIFGQPVNIPVGIRPPSRGAMNRVRRDLNDGIGPVVVDVIANPRTDLFYPGRYRL